MPCPVGSGWFDGLVGLPSDLGCQRERRHRLYNRPAEPRDLSQVLPALGVPASAIRPTSSLKVNRAANEHLTTKVDKRMRSTSVHLGPVSSKTR
jgi:hypothetical protein